MRTLLILGSKPNPVLPPSASFDHLACANASGFSAARHGLPIPDYTVMSAILTARESGKQSLQALAGLQTDTLYFFPRPTVNGHALKKAICSIKRFKMQSFYLKWQLRTLAYHYNHFVYLNWEHYDDLVNELCDYKASIITQIQQKQPSTGIMALVLGIAQQQYDRYILSGFSFELTHAYGRNPEIDNRSAQISKHANTDITVIQYLANKYAIYTTEPIVHQRTGTPLV